MGVFSRIKLCVGSLIWLRSRLVLEKFQIQNLPETMASSSSQEQRPLLQLQQEEQVQEQQQQAPAVKEKECVHKTKAVQFLGRTTPVVLQNDNGPCPLLAICNVLLLRNNLQLSSDISEVPQEKLLSLVAERLIDSNSNINNKDVGYVENQQQNISDAIDLLPRLTTGIDVNTKFKRIDDFEFTPGCAIFDLLDIPLYHGWIVDPQDEATANAIGSKSYNALTSELVTLDTHNMEGKHQSNPEEDCVDFAAATAAALGVPSPSLSKTKSFDESPRAASDHQTARKGDLEEEAELLRAMKLSEGESPVGEGNSVVEIDDMVIVSDSSDESKKAMPLNSGNTTHVQNQTFNQLEAFVPDDCNASNRDSNDLTHFQAITVETASSSLKTEDGNNLDRSACAESTVPVICNDVEEKSNVETQHQTESSASLSLGKDTVSVDSNNKVVSRETEKISESIIAPDANESAAHQNGCVTELSCISAPDADSGSSSGRMQHADAPEALTPSVDDGEPIYEGEERIMESGPTNDENQEPMYEGEVVLAEQADKNIVESCDRTSKDEITPEQGELIRNFLKNNASQLTFYGLFCLQDGLKERELGVFFRNNHFSTMFKYEGELYLLATDQGYLNEPDLVWEKLNEVNGDTVFMTGNFKEFKVESRAPETWDENNVRSSTADYLASIDSASQAGLDINSDLQLAIALQQQEFEQQPQRQNSQQPSVSGGGSRMVTGPQVARSTNRYPTSSSSRPEPKSKDKCTVM